MLERRGLSDTLGYIVRVTGGSEAADTPPDADRMAAAKRIGWIATAVARRLPWRPNCLRRSVVLWWLLRRRCIAAELRIGVRRRRDAFATGEVEFHAWVESRGVVLNDRSDVRQHFATFDRAIVPRDSQWI